MLNKIPLELDEYLWAQWSCTRLAFICAPLGFGKTEFAHRVLQGLDVLEVNAETTDVGVAVTVETARGHDAVLVDNIHDAVSVSQGAALASVVAQCGDTRFVFISRAPMPGWLTPFFAKGDLLIVTNDDLYFTDTDIARLLVANGLAPTPRLVERIAAVTSRYPLAVSLALAHILHGEDAWEEDLTDEAMRYFESEFNRRFDPKVQGLMLLIPLFDRIDESLLTSVLGEADGEMLLDALQHTTCFVTRDSQGWNVNPGMRAFCQWELMRRHDDAARSPMVERAVDYYVAQGNYINALDLCSRAKNGTRMLAILDEHARLNPGSGTYCELEHYYHDLPEGMICASPRLMRTMSLLDSMLMDTVGSERWYTELKDYASAPERTRDERRVANANLAYLDLALPHRRLISLTDAVGALAKVNASDDPELTPSMTSAMPSIINGGRDLSPWVPTDEKTCVLIGKLVERALGRLAVGCIEVALCESKFEKGEDVTPYVARVNAVLPKIRRNGDPSIEFAAIGIQCRNLMYCGDARQALALLDLHRRHFAQSEIPERKRIVANLDALRCHAWLRLGQTERAHAWLEESAPDFSKPLDFLNRYIYKTVSQVYISESRYDEALRLMSTLSEYVKSRDRVIDCIHYDVLAAIAAWRSGKDDWRRWIADALDQAKRYGYVRTITLYGAAVLPLLTEARRHAKEMGVDEDQLARLVRGARVQASHYPNFMSSPSGPAEPLTKTEGQVLRLICQDKSNAEIGELLGIKLPTVKTHVSHILTKLGVSRRAQAASEARRLHLV